MPAETSAKPELITAKECADILKIQPETFYQMLRSGTGPPFKRVGRGGRSIRILQKKFMAWLDKPSPPYRADNERDYD